MEITSTMLDHAPATFSAIADLLLILRAYYFIRKHPIGYRRYAAHLAVIVGCLSIFADLAQVIGWLPSPGYDWFQSVILCLICYMLMIPNPVSVVSQEDYEQGKSLLIGRVMELEDMLAQIRVRGGSGDDRT